eukprot:scaffold132605_cov31-Prasinocladus_malaysianus.AAC.2
MYIGSHMCCSGGLQLNTYYLRSIIKAGSSVLGLYQFSKCGRAIDFPLRSACSRGFWLTKWLWLGSQEALDAELAAKGPHASNTLGIRLRLAQALEDGNKVYETEQLLQSSADEAQESLGPDHWQVGVLYGRLAAFFARLKKFDKYEKAAKTAAESRIAAAAASHAQVRLWHL